MKIAVIIDIWDPIVGGSQTHVWELSSRLVNDYGCKIDIFTRALIDEDGKLYDQREEFFNGQLRVIRVGPATKLSAFLGRALTTFFIACKVIRKNKTENYDLIHAHSILGGAIGRMAGIGIRKPVLFTVHGSPNLDGGRKNIEQHIEKVILTKIKYKKVISVGRSYLTHPNVNEHIETIPNGVDIAKFNQISHADKADFFKILFVGRLDWVKGIDTLIEAVNILKSTHASLLHDKRVQIHLIGYGFEKKKYENMASRYGLDEFIIFRGKITGDDLIEEYKSSHLFILPSICEGQPITLLEAMAASLPVITTFSADNAGVVDPNTGWKVEKKNPEDLASAIGKVMDMSESTLEGMGKDGYKKVIQNFTWEIVADKTVKIYKTLI